MTKIEMREWVCSLELMTDRKLSKWRKENKIENGEAVQLRWQWEQIHFHLDIFWEEGKESVNLHYFSPRVSHSYQWHGLNQKTLDKLADRIGNLAQTAMHPPIDPSDSEEDGH